MTGRPSTASRAGLDAKLTHARDGTWTIVLVDDQGTEVFRKAGYKTEESAKGGASYWVQKNYQVETRDSPPKKRASPNTKKAPTAARLNRLLIRADDNRKRATELMAEAQRLTEEAERLSEAADALGGSNGQQT